MQIAQCITKMATREIHTTTTITTAKVSHKNCFKYLLANFVFYLIKVIDMNVKRKKSAVQHKCKGIFSYSLLLLQLYSESVLRAPARTFTTALLFILRNKCHFLQNIRQDNAIAKFSSDNKSYLFRGNQRWMAIVSFY